MDKYIFMLRRGDINTIEYYKNTFHSISDKKLIEEYNREFDIGITGVHHQALLLLVLNDLFSNRFKDSPIRIEGNTLISFKGRLCKIDNDKIIYEDNLFTSISTRELIEKYNKEYDRGFVGVMMQRGYVINLGEEFIRRFNDTPVMMKNPNDYTKNVSLKGKIKAIINNKIYYENK